MTAKEVIAELGGECGVFKDAWNAIVGLMERCSHPGARERGRNALTKLECLVAQRGLSVSFEGQEHHFPKWIDQVFPPSLGFKQFIDYDETYSGSGIDSRVRLIVEENNKSRPDLRPRPKSGVNAGKKPVKGSVESSHDMRAEMVEQARAEVFRAFPGDVESQVLYAPSMVGCVVLVVSSPRGQLCNGRRFVVQGQGTQRGKRGLMFRVHGPTLDESGEVVTRVNPKGEVVGHQSTFHVRDVKVVASSLEEYRNLRKEGGAS